MATSIFFIEGRKSNDMYVHETFYPKESEVVHLLQTESMTVLAKSRIHYRVKLLRQVWQLCSQLSMQLSLYYFVISLRLHQLYTTFELIMLEFRALTAAWLLKSIVISRLGIFACLIMSYCSLHCRYSRLKDSTAIRQPYKLLYSNRFRLN